ncbi:zinc finger BED domain-containing protein 4-like [Leptopilina heterotoma]|uniref:zinc finger BED domain-containing protein 4-like n=1 Tax=Leptopilina heterotoma TaxID=63436 RepID=UPI001CA7F041|nr:zinc finger BED domain-containing protein 4-like [Leptopilina heterotoma]
MFMFTSFASDKIPLISMKVDIASRHNRSFFGLNIQFVKDGALHLRTLAVRELFSSHTSENLKIVVNEILSNYNIFNDRIYTFTSDNGRNMVKLGELLQETQVEEDSVDEAVNNEVNFSATTLVRCCVHTLQLAVLDAINDPSVNRIIAKARHAVKALRNESTLQTLKKKYNVNKPTLDVVTRWSSTCSMLASLLSAKEFCKDFEAEKPALSLADEEWCHIEDCLKALSPCKKATLRLQTQNLVPGDVYGIWYTCKLETERIDTLFAKKLKSSMIKREKHLMENEALLASMFLDPRYLPLLKETTMKIAKETLLIVWDAIKKTNEEETQVPPTEDSLMELDEDVDLLSLEIQRRDAERQFRLSNGGVSQIESLLDEFAKTPKIPLKEDILKYWEVRKSSSPELYSLATIVHAAPMTQVSVERLFSGMKFIISDLRTNLSHDMIDDILIVRTNKNFQKDCIAEEKPAKKKKIIHIENMSSDNLSTGSSSTELIDDELITN